jgi:hypothetical protein
MVFGEFRKRVHHRGTENTEKTMSELFKAIEQIENLEHTRYNLPKMLTEQEIQRLDIYADCPNCQTHYKVRAFAANIEIEDVVAESLVWLIRDNRFDEIVEKYKKFVLKEHN